jgi:hypothetical protein
VLVILLYSADSDEGQRYARLYVIAVTGVTDLVKAFVTQKSDAVRHKRADAIE